MSRQYAPSSFYEFCCRRARRKNKQLADSARRNRRLDGAKTRNLFTLKITAVKRVTAESTRTAFESLSAALSNDKQ